MDVFLYDNYCESTWGEKICVCRCCRPKQSFQQHVMYWQESPDFSRTHSWPLRGLEVLRAPESVISAKAPPALDAGISQCDLLFRRPHVPPAHGHSSPAQSAPESAGLMARLFDKTDQSTKALHLIQWWVNIISRLYILRTCSEWTRQYRVYFLTSAALGAPILGCPVQPLWLQSPIAVVLVLKHKSISKCDFV